MIPLIIIFSIGMALLYCRVRPVKDRAVSLDERFPLWKVEKDCILAKNGDITVCYQLTLPEIFSLSDDEYEALHDYWLKAIRLLPAGMTLHKQDLFHEAHYKADFMKGDQDAEDYIKSSSERFFNERPYLQHTCFLFFTWPGSGIAKRNRPASSASSNLFKSSITGTKVTDHKHMSALSEPVNSFTKVLSDSGFITLRRLRAAEITGSRNAPGILERYLFLLKEGASPVLKDIQLQPDWKIGADFPLLFTLADAQHLPERSGSRVHYARYATDKTRFAIGFAAPVGLLLPVSHIYNQYIRIVDPAATLKRLEAKRKRLQSLSTYSRENSIGRDATTDFLNEAIAGHKLPVKAHFNVLAWTGRREDVKEVRNHTAAALSQLGATPYQETAGAPQLWWAGLPGNAGALPENECFDSFAEQASCFLNQETAYRSSDSPFGIRLGDRLSGVPVHVDISDEPMKKGITTNRNKIVVGGSGSGKSMFMNHLLHSYVQQGAHCIVVDVGHSYEGLCQLVKGYYFTYREDSPIAFNPFYVSPGAQLDTEKKESIKTLLVALWKQGDEPFRRSEYVAISGALTGYYTFLKDSAKTIFPCFDSFYEYLETSFVEQLKKDGVQDGDFDIHNFLYVLRPYYKGGEFDYLLNAREHLDMLSQPFIVFELDNVKDHPILFPVITLIIMEMFISKMRKLKGVRKVIVIEEAWKAIARSGMAEFMKYLYKTVRKYYGEAITVTQEVDDIISSPVIKEAIINNADCKILLDMKKFQNKFTSIQQVLGMTDKGRDLVLSLNRANEPDRKYREVYIELGGQLMKVYRYEPSFEAYYAYSTEQSDKLLVQEYTEKSGGDIRRGLTALVRDIQRKQDS